VHHLYAARSDGLRLTVVRYAEYASAGEDRFVEVPGCKGAELGPQLSDTHWQVITVPAVPWEDPNNYNHQAKRHLHAALACFSFRFLFESLVLS
jgi:hypothetical protein